MQIDVNNWKSATIPKDQLSLNLQELSSKYPRHWKSIIDNSKYSIEKVDNSIGTYLLKRV
jgi:hypothetical protein